MYPLEAAPFAYVCNDQSTSLHVIDVATNTVISRSPIKGNRFYI
jgi:YVTN family beta-propeller protein